MAQSAPTEIQPARLQQYLTDLVRAHITENPGSGISPFSPELSPAELNFDDLDIAEVEYEIRARTGMSWGQGDEVYRIFSDPSWPGAVSKEPIGAVINKVSDYIIQQAQADPDLKKGLERVLASSS